MKKQNQCHPSIKFEYEISKTEINFLDTTVFKVDNKPRTKVYAKPTDRQTDLHSKSGSTKFATIEAIFITTVSDYLTR